MSYLLDTNAAIAVIKNKPTPVRERLRRVLGTQAQIDISSVVLYELEARPETPLTYGDGHFGQAELDIFA